jgi:excisionase family DNA binding protein
MANDGQQYLTVREVAERLRLHPITVRRHIAAGRIRAVRIGRAVRVPEEEVRRLTNQQGTRVADTKAKYRTGRVGLHRARELSDEQWATAREAARRLIELRDAMPPMNISTTELVRLARQEVEERDERRARGSR